MKKKKHYVLPSTPDPTMTSSDGMISQILRVFRGLSTGGKALLFVILASHLPLILLALNSIPLPFDVGVAAYQHMGMIARIVDGLPLYTSSSSEHSVVTYTPLYWGIVAAFSKLFGLSFTIAKLVSIAASIVVWFVVAGFVWVNTKRNLILSVTAPAALFSASILLGNWTMDVNVNALHFAFVIAGFFCLREPLTTRRVAASAILLALGVLAKQTGLAYIAAAGFLVLVTAPKRLPVFAILSGGIVVAAFLILQKTSGGQFWTQIGPANAQLPWFGRRIVDEILVQSFLGYGGVLTALAIYSLATDWKPNIFLLARQPHYVLLGAGILVACIAHPKYGSGGIHDIIALAGIYICGCIGLHKLAEPGGSTTRRFLAVFPLTQLAILLLVGQPVLKTLFTTPQDEEKYEKVARIFHSGRTCLFGIPYIQHVFNQPVSGIPDDEFSKWKNGRLDYSALPDLYMKPFRDEGFDFVIIADYFDPQHPVCKTIIEHYPILAERIPATPPANTSLRHELVVLRPRRAANAAPVPQPAAPRQNFMLPSLR